MLAPCTKGTRLRFHRSTAPSCIVIILLIGSFAILATPGFSQVNILTNKTDNTRSGLNSSETLLTAANVNSGQFGKLYAFNVDGYVSAQPLYMSGLTVNGASHNVVFVATEHDSVFAIDADTGVQLWQTSFINPSAGVTAVPASDQGCTGVTGFNEVGIMGTPVIDSTTNTLYVSAKTKESGAYIHRLHALDVTTGLEKAGSPIAIAGTFGSLNFDTLHLMQRPGLLLSNGVLYLGFGSNGCDLTGRGWVMAYSASGLQQLGVFVTQPDNSYGSSVWQGGVGLAADSLGNVYLSTGNGLFNAGINFPDYGDSVLKLGLNSGVLSAQDYFTPFDQANMATNDWDLGSGGITLLPDQSGTYPHLLVAASKNGNIYVINRDNLGQYNPVDNSQIPQYISGAFVGEFFGSALYWNNTLYFLAHQDSVKAYSLTNGVLSSTPVIQTSSRLTSFGLPAISANGASNGIVWVVRSLLGTPLLTAYNATNLRELYDSGQVPTRDTLGIVPHFATPIIANGKVFAGTQTQLVAYGLLPALAATSGGNQSGPAGSVLPQPLKVTASNPYTGAPISGVTVSFSDGGKGGTFNPPSGVTDANGNLSTTYTLPATGQTVTVTATSSGFASAVFTETATSDVASIGVVSGGKQTGTVGTTLPAPIVMKAKDAQGNSVSGLPITFNDGGAGGTFTPSSGIVTTGSNGQASITYTLPTKARSITITGAYGTISNKVSVSSVAAAPATLSIVSGNNQKAHANTQLAKPLVVSVKDQYGNNCSGVTVSFTDNGAGGTLSKIAPVTGANGQASVTYTTPPNTGTVTITGSVSNLSPVNFTVTVQ